MKQLASLKVNIYFLIVVQSINFLMPLIAYPFMATKMGAQKFGEILYIYSFMGLIGILIEFGFSLGGVKDISVRRGNKLKISNYILSAWCIQVALLFLYYLSCILFLALTQKDELLKLMYSIGFLIIVGQIFSSNWVFQGLEMLREAAMIQVVSKILSFPILFFYVQGPNDGVYALIFLVASSFLSGILSFYWIYKTGLINTKIPSLRFVFKLLKINTSLFFSKLIIALYTTLIPVVLENISGPAELAKYALADKVRMSIQSILSPVSQAIFPRMSYLFRTNFVKAKELILKTSFIVGGLSISAACFVSIYSEKVMLFLGGPDFAGSGIILLWLSFVPCLTVVSNVLGIQIMLPLNLKKEFNLIVSIGGIISLICIWPAVVNSGSLGAATVVFMSELFISGSMVVYFLFSLRKKF